MSTYLVYLKEDYVRDAQGYLFGTVSEISEREEEGWGDVSGPVLLMQFEAQSDEEAWDRVIRWYPEADPEVFEMEKVRELENVKGMETDLTEAVKEAENGWIETERRE